MEFVLRFRERIGHYFPSSCTVVPPNSLSTVDLSLDESVPEENLEVEERSPVVEAAAAGTNNFDWSTLFMAFCLTSGVEMALYSLQAGNAIPLCFQLLSFAILLAFASLFVGRYIKCNYRAESQVLEQAGILFATTAFYLAMTMPFSLFLKGCSWGLYFFSLLAVAICNRS